MREWIVCAVVVGAWLYMALQSDFWTVLMVGIIQRVMGY